MYLKNTNWVDKPLKLSKTPNQLLILHDTFYHRVYLQILFSAYLLRPGPPHAIFGWHANLSYAVYSYGQLIVQANRKWHCVIWGFNCSTPTASVVHAYGVGVV